MLLYSAASSAAAASTTPAIACSPRIGLRHDPASTCPRRSDQRVRTRSLKTASHVARPSSGTPHAAPRMPRPPPADTGAILEPACARSGTTVEVPAEAAGARLRPRCRARRRVRLVVRRGSIRCCRPGPAARDPGLARSPPPSGPQPGASQRPALRRPTPGPERPAPRARSDRAPVQPVQETASTCRNSVALIGYVPLPILNASTSGRAALHLAVRGDAGMVIHSPSPTPSPGASADRRKSFG
jgi:hypothetical protein